MKASAIVSSGFRLTTLEETSILLISLILYTCLFLSGRFICGTKFPKSIWAPTGLLFVYLVFLIGSNIWEKFSIVFPLTTLICLTFFGIIKSQKTIKIDLEQYLLSLYLYFHFVGWQLSTIIRFGMTLPIGFHRLVISLNTDTFQLLKTPT